jgi:hypothetical protein
MEIKKFRSAYGLELIPASHEGILLGDLVWDPVLGPPSFSRKGMPNTIFTAFLDAGLITEKEWTAMQEETLEAPLKMAHFASKTVQVDVEFLSELQHPKIGKIQGEFLTRRVSKFTFGDLQVREMDDLSRVRIDHYLEQMKATRWQEYDGRIRRVNLITELYYGTIRLVVEKQYGTELEAILKNTDLQATTVSEGTHATEYEFSHDNVPFAMRIERIRTFNG